MQTVFSSFCTIRRWRFTLTALFFGAAGLPALAACPSEPGRFVPHGAEVMDTKTGLIWARCSVGQAWTGHNCAGEVSRMSYHTALEYAASRGDWRLPNRKELFSLADKGCFSPAIDSTVFPDTQASGYWTSTPRFGYGGADGWLVTFYDGHIYYSFGLNVHGVIRLVRSSQ